VVRSSSAASILAGMGQVELVRVDLTLELARETDPPSGRILVGALSHPFTGWLGLALALQTAIDEGHEQRATEG
jgi:hypothetical protein